ncbi:hypothetical protein TWF481_002795 [Arthrobotrys musiformis]|uniref:HNH nuclease domain-containing protein n=1 Tax=Arthrobotrys musiformis TaxID=47236 RepID=A0AAV9VSC8_9PEZI
MAIDRANATKELQLMPIPWDRIIEGNDHNVLLALGQSYNLHLWLQRLLQQAYDHIDAEQIKSTLLSLGCQINESYNLRSHYFNHSIDYIPGGFADDVLQGLTNTLCKSKSKSNTSLYEKIRRALRKHLEITETEFPVSLLPIQNGNIANFIPQLPNGNLYAREYVLTSVEVGLMHFVAYLPIEHPDEITPSESLAWLLCYSNAALERWRMHYMQQLLSRLRLGFSTSPLPRCSRFSQDCKISIDETQDKVILPRGMDMISNANIEFQLKEATSKPNTGK